MGKSRTPRWEPSPGDYLQVFHEQNPWFTTESVPQSLAPPVERQMARSLWRRLEHDRPRRFQLILGPRRVGKTTVMYQTVRHLLRRGIDSARLYWTRLDHPLLMQFDLGNHVRAILESRDRDQLPLYLFLDELVYARDWDRWLKTFHDEQWPVRIVGTSSATAALQTRRLESGIGRWEEQHLSPYSFAESLDLAGKGIELPIAGTLGETLRGCIEQGTAIPPLAADRRRYLFTGGFPELLLGVLGAAENEEQLLLESQRTLREDAVERALYKDIPQAFNIDNPMLLERLLYTLAGQVTGLLSPQDMSGALGIHVPSLERYLSYLEQAFLIFTLQNYSGSEGGRQRRGRRLYFVDGAVRNAALQRGLAPQHNRAELGLLTENLACSQLFALGRQTQVRVYHWREKNLEVDLIYDDPGQPLAFEISLARRHRLEGLRALGERFPAFRGHSYLVAEGCANVLPEKSPDGVGRLNLDLFLVALGRQAAAALEARMNV